MDHTAINVMGGVTGGLRNYLDYSGAGLMAVKAWIKSGEKNRKSLKISPKHTAVGPLHGC